MSDDSLRNLNEVDRLIHEPARLAITSILYAVEEADFLYLKRELALTKGNLSSHLIKLETAGYVNIEKTIVDKRTRTVCTLTSTGKQVFEKYLRQMEKVMQFTKGGLQK
ncbi:MAG: transcriptional regulator [Anaerolineaceae bacterium]|nr:transcriptional regulator [Anaerolineaceae bacterium]